jgi:hypothetical protein
MHATVAGRDKGAVSGGRPCTLWCDACGVQVPRKGWADHISGVKHCRLAVSRAVNGPGGPLVRSIFEDNPPPNYRGKDPLLSLLPSTSSAHHAASALATRRPATEAFRRQQAGREARHLAAGGPPPFPAEAGSHSGRAWPASSSSAASGGPASHGLSLPAFSPAEAELTALATAARREAVRHTGVQGRLYHETTALLQPEALLRAAADLNARLAEYARRGGAGCHGSGDGQPVALALGPAELLLLALHPVLQLQQASGDSGSGAAARGAVAAAVVGPPLRRLSLQVPFRPHGREAAAGATALCVLLEALSGKAPWRTAVTAAAPSAATAATSHRSSKREGGAAPASRSQGRRDESSPSSTPGGRRGEASAPAREREPRAGGPAAAAPLAPQLASLGVSLSEGEYLQVSDAREGGARRSRLSCQRTPRGTSPVAQRLCFSQRCSPAPSPPPLSGPPPARPPACRQVVAQSGGTRLAALQPLWSHVAASLGGLLRVGPRPPRPTHRTATSLLRSSRPGPPLRPCIACRRCRAAPSPQRSTQPPPPRAAACSAGRSCASCAWRCRPACYRPRRWRRCSGPPPTPRPASRAAWRCLWAAMAV